MAKGDKVERRLPPSLKIKGKRLPRKFPRTPYLDRNGPLMKKFEGSWVHVPMSVRVIVAGVLMGAVALIMPFWGYILLSDTEADTTTFGLWNICHSGGSVCPTIRDNLLEGVDIPVWFMVMQISYFIGVMCAALAMFVIWSNTEKERVKMPPTVKQFSMLMMLVSVLHQLGALYIFVKSFNNMDFLHESFPYQQTDVYWAFYLAVCAVICTALGPFILYIEEEIHISKIRQQKKKEEILKAPLRVDPRVLLMQNPELAKKYEDLLILPETKLTEYPSQEAYPSKARLPQNTLLECAESMEHHILESSPLLQQTDEMEHLENPEYFNYYTYHNNGFEQPGDWKLSHRNNHVEKQPQ